ncbi:MAG: exodeoxyribonuclease VII small subunit [Syntrophaceae bacterium]|nr:exodeoxyribonuclease VII small subunit [Syntrophaceae bacterium]
MARKNQQAEPKETHPELEKTEKFDVTFEKLKTIVEKMETGGLSLDESLSLFEEGVRLSKTLFVALNLAEGKVEELLSNMERSPFSKGE